MISSAACKVVRAFIGALLVAALTNCGLKGDLYLPEPEEVANDQTGKPDSTDSAKEVTTTPGESSTAVDEDKEKTVGKPPEGALPQP